MISRFPRTVRPARRSRARREAADLERRTRLWRRPFRAYRRLELGRIREAANAGSRSPPLRCVVDSTSIRSNPTGDPTSMGAPRNSARRINFDANAYGSIYFSFQSLPVSHGDRSGEVGR